MSNAKLQTKIKWLIRDHLGELGFSLWKPRIPERPLDGFVQGIEFQPGSGHKAGQYTLNIYWRFTMVCDRPGRFDGCQRIGSLLGEQDTWFSREGDKLDPHFDRVRELILEHVIPYLRRHDTIPKILQAVADGCIPERMAFGSSICWRHFNYGCCHAFVGNRKEALLHFRKVVDEYSNEPLDWVKERKAMALKQIEKITGA